MSPAKPRRLTPRQEAASVDTATDRLKELAEDPKLARLVAANPSASAELMLELSRSDDKAVRKVCQHAGWQAGATGGEAAQTAAGRKMTNRFI